jgi:hypothetical protein
MQAPRTSSGVTVVFDAAPTASFKRIQLLLRVLVLVGLSMLHRSELGLLGLLYFSLPVMAAVLITQRGPVQYLESDAPWLVSLLEWVMGFYAYMLFVTDVFPLDRRHRAVHLTVNAGGAPSVASALLRLVSSLPFLLVLMVAGVGAFLVSVIGAFSILLYESYPEAMRSYQQTVVSWMAQLFAYHASLVDAYPTLDSRDHTEVCP